MSWFVYLPLFVLFISYISSLRAFRLDMALPFRQFSFFLLFLFLGEVFGIAWPKILYRLTPFSRNNQWYYNLYHFCCCLFYLYFFYQILQSARMKKVIKTLTIVYILFVTINIIFIQGFMELNSYTELFNCFLVVFLSIAYYYQLLYAKEVISLKHDAMFWISTGLLIYHLGSMMGLFLINVMNLISNEKALSILYIIQFAALLMYLTFSIAFLCQKKK
jgi:hypothetical protein